MTPIPERIAKLIREGRITFEGEGKKHIYRGELTLANAQETLEKGFFILEEQLRKRFPEKSSSFHFSYYFLHKIRNFLQVKYVLLGFYISGDLIRIGHFSQCISEVKFYKELSNSL